MSLDFSLFFKPWQSSPAPLGGKETAPPKPSDGPHEKQLLQMSAVTQLSPSGLFGLRQVEVEGEKP